MSELAGQRPSPLALCVLRVGVLPGLPRTCGQMQWQRKIPVSSLGVGSAVSPMSHPTLASAAASSLSTGRVGFMCWQRSKSLTVPKAAGSSGALGERRLCPCVYTPLGSRSEAMPLAQWCYSPGRALRSLLAPNRLFWSSGRERS